MELRKAAKETLPPAERLTAAKKTAERIVHRQIREEYSALFNRRYQERMVGVKARDDAVAAKEALQ